MNNTEKIGLVCAVVGLIGLVSIGGVFHMEWNPTPPPIKATEYERDARYVGEHSFTNATPTNLFFQPNLIVVETRPENLKAYWSKEPDTIVFADYSTERWLEITRINREAGWGRTNCFFTLSHKPTVTESNGVWIIKFEKEDK